MAEAPKFNLRNPAVKRIMQEIKEIKQDTSGDFLAEALETDIFEWHFVIRGPRDTEFEGGIFHGRILLPAEYPFKPPSFMMLTPNGRFETSVKICLSISSHHPEHWQPSWSVRTALTAMIAFMPSPGSGALGALDFTKDERRLLAARSRTELPRFGSAERQRVIEEMHARMLAVEAEKEAERAVQASTSDTGASTSRTSTDRPPAAGEEQQPKQQLAGEEEVTLSGNAGTGPAAASTTRASGEAGSSQSTKPASIATAAAATSSPAPSYRPPAAAAPATPMPMPGGAYAAAAAANANTAAVTAAAAAGGGATSGADHMLTALLWALYVGIGAILVRKVMGAMGMDLTELLKQ